MKEGMGTILHGGNMNSIKVAREGGNGEEMAHP